MNFPRNNNGELDVSNETYSKEKITLKKCKYTEEFHLCLGVAVVNPVIDGVENIKKAEGKNL